jgi:NhaP-type Na+/H+ or K+/H+ antiporter
MFSDQIVLSYCGIRGAVCFCLAQLADPAQVPPRQLFLTTLLALILFSTFIQVGTTKICNNVINGNRRKALKPIYIIKNICYITSTLNKK